MNTMTTAFLSTYRKHVAARAVEGLPPLPLNAEQVFHLITLIQDPPPGEEAALIAYLSQRVPPGVDPAAYHKAAFLSAIAQNTLQTPLLTAQAAIQLLGTMLGGYNVAVLVALLDAEDPSIAEAAQKALTHTVLLFDAYHDVLEKHRLGNPFATQLLQAWAEASWFTARPAFPESIELIVFKLSGETNTDDLSPATEAWSRPDIPLHAKTLLHHRLPGAISHIQALKQQGYPVVFVGDVVGTGSSRKSAINSLLWHIGTPIPFVPNKHRGGVIFGTKIAPIFRTTAEDAGALPIELDVSGLETGEVITLQVAAGQLLKAGKLITRFALTPMLLDAWRAGGRLSFIIGRALTDKTRHYLNLKSSPLFCRAPRIETSGKQAYTLAQKMVGKACGLTGIKPGTYCEPRMSAVGSQDTTGPMTRDELKELACLGFSADLVMQSFCHTAAYPKPVDIAVQQSLPDFFAQRGGVVLRPGDGVIHPWLNRMLLPDEVGTGGDSHTRFPIGISFPGGSGVVAFAAAMGVMPLTMPESVRVRFKGEMQPGITLRDLVHAIPYIAIQRGLLTVSSHNKQNIFSNRILEIEGLPQLKVEQAFEFADASAERSANGCTVHLSPDSVIEYLRSNISLLKWMIRKGYQDIRSLQRRITAMEEWLKNPQLLSPDKEAEYIETIEIDLNEIKEPLLACPNNPDDIRPLSVVANTPIDEVFIGSCMTNIGHYRAAGQLFKKFGKRVPTLLWIAPPTKMDARQLMTEGYYAIYGDIGARTEMPGCSLCMGNQARVRDHATVVSTSTRNFPNRMGKEANVYLASAELTAVSAILGRLPTVEEYQHYLADLQPMAAAIYRYLNFDQLPEYTATS
jgi:aconitate hydratase 2 / 2-methylisocitrate dehydratase